MMGWKAFWHAMREPFRPPADPREAHLADLRAQLQAERELRVELLRQLKVKDEQIRMVIEERFYRPVLTGEPSPPSPAPPMFDAETLNDVTQFDDREDARLVRMSAEDLERWRAEHSPEAAG